MAIYNIKFDGHQRKLIVDYSYTKQVPFIDKRYDFELSREIEFRNHKAEKAKGTYEIAYSVAEELNLIDVEALQKVCEGEMPIKSTDQALNIFGVSQRSELLAFWQWYNKKYTEYYADPNLIDRYLKEKANCG